MRPDLWTRILARAIGVLAPQTALRFAHNRTRLLSYVGASRRGHNALWKPARQSADAILRKDNALLVARARDLVRNYTYVEGGLCKIVDNVVHTGIRPQFTHAVTKEPLDKLENKWKVWAGKIGFAELQGLALRHWWVDGEILAHDWLDSDWLKDNLCPLRITLHETDIFNETFDGWINEHEYARRGIVFNIKGDPVRYECYTGHPGDYLPGALDTISYPADHITHFFLRLRASQTRGVSRLAPIIEEIKDLSEYQSSERIAARLAASFGIFIKTQNYADSYASMGGRPDDQDDERFEINDAIAPGRIQELPPGYEVQTAKSDRPGNTYEPYVRTSLKGQSVGFGLRYGNYSHDYTESSYASERSAALDERRGWQGQQFFLNSRFNTPIAKKWLNTMHGCGMLDGLRPEDVTVAWQNPGWPWVDPTKDAKAAEMELAMRTTTRRRICAAKGYDYDEIEAELQREEAGLPKSSNKEVEDEDEKQD